MKIKIWKITIQLLSAITLAAFIIAYLNKDFPLVGRDFMYFLPRLTDTLLHYKVNGLSIQWYTPSFVGGIPAYPNPQNMQFSLPQLFTEFMDPWNATIASTIVFALIGYFSAFYFLTRTLNLRWEAGVLGGLFFAVNGFFIEHLAAGHLPYHTFALLPLILIALFTPLVPEMVAGIIIAFVVAILLNEASFYMVVIFSLSCLLTLPILYLYDPSRFNLRRLVRILLFAGVFSLLLTGSKLYAVYSFMRFFPRHVADHYHVTLLSGLKGLLFQLLGTMNLVPIRLLLGKSINTMDDYLRFWTGAPWGLWEVDVSLSPVLFLFLGLGIIYLGIALARKKMTFKASHWVALTILVLATWLTVEFTLARGVLYPMLRKLPILNSMHANVRFASAFIFPLAMLGGLSYEKIASRMKFFRSPLLHSALVILTLAGQFIYFAYTKDMEDRAFSITTTIQTYKQIQAGNTFPVEAIADVNDDQTFIDGASDLWSNDPLFGAHYLDRLPADVIPGPVTDVRDGKFNLTDPSGYVYPEVNQTTEYARIPATEADKLHQFTHRYQPNWKRPLIQNVLDVVSLLSFIALTGGLVGVFVYRWLKRRRWAPGMGKNRTNASA
ncbi:MAG TPA: hypothetical protein VMC09_13400 [Anaerolineales bacterium]|nr:hypothetical protein [Anaerolineales bacterium]